MLVGKAHIEKYLPQRAPMVMVDALLEATEAHAITQLHLEAENLFVSNGILSEAGLIENMAQTAAAQAGYLAQQQNMPTPVGFIASISDLKINSFPSVGAILTTSISITNRVFDVIIINARTTQHSQEFCSCQMKIFIKPESHAHT